MSLIYAFASTLIFSIASVIFSSFSKKLSAMWMSAFKASIALLTFGVATVFVYDSSSKIYASSTALLFLSGFIGLNLGDFFLFKAFQRIGSSRTLMIFSFQPFFMAIAAYIFFGQSISLSKCVALVVLVGCIMTMSYERYRRDGQWEKLGPLFALLGVILDAIGVLMTRQAFELSPQLPIFEANFFRCLGAAIGFLFFARFFPFNFRRRFSKLKLNTKLLIIGASFFGTFVALGLYLTAIQKGELAEVTAIVGCGPLFSAVFECLSARKWPSKFLWASLLLFVCGFALMMR